MIAAHGNRLGRLLKHHCRMLPLAVALVMALPLLVGCGGKKAPPPQPRSAPSAAKAAPAIMSMAEERVSVPSYIYSPVGKRDPFRSYYKVMKGGKPKPKVGGILTHFEIDQLKLTAIISGIARPRAQVELPDGKGVVVKVGTRIGKNYGRVVRIKSDEVVIAEDFRDHLGRKMTNYIHMRLEKKPGEL